MTTYSSSSSKDTAAKQQVAAAAAAGPSSSRGGGGGSLAVLTYNVWGLFSSKNLDTRMRLIAARLGRFDVVCLQEQFLAKDFAALETALPYSVRYQSSFIGSGLAVLSRFPIVNQAFFPYACQGSYLRVLEGDSYAYKGVAATTIRVPKAVLMTQQQQHESSPSSTEPSSKRKAVAAAGAEDEEEFVDVVVLNTHLIACYQKYTQVGFLNERNAAVRLSQVVYLASIIGMAAAGGGGGRPVILGGDFNFSPASPEMALLVALCRDRHGIQLTSAVAPGSPPLCTYSTENAYNSDSSVIGKMLAMQEDCPVQLDHILFTGPLGVTDGGEAQLAFATPVMPDTSPASTSAAPAAAATSPAAPIFMSDHFGIQCRLAFSSSSSSSSTVFASSKEGQGAPLAELAPPLKRHMLSKALAFESQAQRFKRLAQLGGAVLALELIWAVLLSGGGGGGGDAVGGQVPQGGVLSYMSLLVAAAFAAGFSVMLGVVLCVNRLGEAANLRTIAQSLP